MRRVEQRLAAALEQLHLVENRIAALWIDADGRLVEQEDVGIVQQAGGQVQPALHAAAERPDAIAPPLGQLHEIEGRADRTLQRRAGKAEKAAEKPEIGVRRQLVVERQLLRHRADAPFHGIGVTAKRLTGDPDLAAIGLQQTGNHRDRRRLARAVRSEQTEQLPALDPERHIVYGDERAEGFAKMCNFQH